MYSECVSIQCSPSQHNSLYRLCDGMVDIQKECGLASLCKCFRVGVPIVSRALPFEPKLLASGFLELARREQRCARSPQFRSRARIPSLLSCLAEVRELTLERNHRVSVVGDCNIAQRRHGPWDLICTEEAKDTELGEASVVELCCQAALFCLFRHVLVEAERIVEVYGRKIGNVSAKCKVAISALQ